MTQVVLEGQQELVRELRALGGPALRRIAKRVASTAMAPVIGTAKALVPVGPTGRLMASLGKMATQNRRGDAFSSRVGTRRDFTYKNQSGTKMVSGQGKVRARALAKGYTQDARSAQQYARLIEFGPDRKGRLRRKAGGAHFLETAITTHERRIIATVTSELRRYVETPP